MPFLQARQRYHRPSDFTSGKTTKMCFLDKSNCSQSVRQTSAKLDKGRLSVGVPKYSALARSCEGDEVSSMYQNQRLGRNKDHPRTAGRVPWGIQGGPDQSATQELHPQGYGLSALHHAGTVAATPTARTGFGGVLSSRRHTIHCVVGAEGVNATSPSR